MAGKPTTQRPSKLKPLSAVALRRCLGPCGRLFRSTGPGNRICWECEQKVSHYLFTLPRIRKCNVAEGQKAKFFHE